jgi:hypothetical protein
VKIEICRRHRLPPACLFLPPASSAAGMPVSAAGIVCRRHARNWITDNSLQAGLQRFDGHQNGTMFVLEKGQCM